MVTGKSPDWLPPGFTEKVKANDGRKYKVYTELSTGSKFYSRPEVTRYLETLDQSNNTNTTEIIKTDVDDVKEEIKADVNDVEEELVSSPGMSPITGAVRSSKRKKKGNHVFKAVATEVVAADGLPPGWIKDIKISKNGNRMRKDMYYTDPVSGYVFLSFKDALRYVETNDISRCATRPKKRELDDVELIKNEIIPSSSVKELPEPVETKTALFFHGKSNGGEESSVTKVQPESEAKIFKEMENNKSGELTEQAFIAANLEEEQTNTPQKASRKSKKRKNPSLPSRVGEESSGTKAQPESEAKKIFKETENNKSAEPTNQPFIAANLEEKQTNTPQRASRKSKRNDPILPLRVGEESSIAKVQPESEANIFKATEKNKSAEPTNQACIAANLGEKETNTPQKASGKSKERNGPSLRSRVGEGSYAAKVQPESEAKKIFKETENNKSAEPTDQAFIASNSEEKQTNAHKRTSRNLKKRNGPSLPLCVGEESYTAKVQPESEVKIFKETENNKSAEPTNQAVIAANLDEKQTNTPQKASGNSEKRNCPSLRVGEGSSGTKVQPESETKKIFEETKNNKSAEPTNQAVIASNLDEKETNTPQKASRKSNKRNGPSLPLRASKRLSRSEPEVGPNLVLKEQSLKTAAPKPEKSPSFSLQPASGVPLSSKLVPSKDGEFTSEKAFQETGLSKEPAVLTDKFTFQETAPPSAPLVISGKTTSQKTVPQNEPLVISGKTTSQKTVPQNEPSVISGKKSRKNAPSKQPAFISDKTFRETAPLKETIFTSDKSFEETGSSKEPSIVRCRTFQETGSSKEPSIVRCRTFQETGSKEPAFNNAFQETVPPLNFEKTLPEDLGFPFGTSWQDPCLEFAFKTLIGELPLEDNFSFPEISNNHTEERSGPSDSDLPPGFETELPPAANLSFSASPVNVNLNFPNYSVFGPESDLPPGFERAVPASSQETGPVNQLPGAANPSFFGQGNLNYTNFSVFGSQRFGPSSEPDLPPGFTREVPAHSKSIKPNGSVDQFPAGANPPFSVTKPNWLNDQFPSAVNPPFPVFSEQIKPNGHQPVDQLPVGVNPPYSGSGNLSFPNWDRSVSQQIPARSEPLNPNGPVDQLPAGANPPFSGSKNLSFPNWDTYGSQQIPSKPNVPVDQLPAGANPSFSGSGNLSFPSWDRFGSHQQISFRSEPLNLNGPVDQLPAGVNPSGSGNLSYRFGSQQILAPSEPLNLNGPVDQFPAGANPPFSGSENLVFSNWNEFDSQQSGSGARSKDNYQPKVSFRK